VLHDVGLVAATDWLAEDLERSYGLAVEVSAKDELEDLDDASRVTLFRALRELLINVARHSGTRYARVHIERRGAMAEIAVEDHGVGFDPDAGVEGFGLASLGDRLEHLGGGVAIDSAPGRGTTVRVWAPSDADERRGAEARQTEGGR
jgi:signal transduction histidine kinase